MVIPVNVMPVRRVGADATRRRSSNRRARHHRYPDYLAGMRTSLSVAVFIVAGLSSPATAQTTGMAHTIPSVRLTGLSQGMEYEKARAVVLDQGWQASITNPMHKSELQQGLQSYFIGKGFHEVDECLPTGLGTCTAIFHDDRGRKLFLFTSEPADQGARLSAWCLGRRTPNCSR